MNAVDGIIIAIKSSGSLSQVEVIAGKHKFKTVVIDTPETNDYLRLGHQVKLLFKETEVAIGIGDLSNISLQNRIFGTILKLELGELQGKVTLETTIGVVKSIITADAVEQLQLREGMDAVALIKTNEIMLTA